jgi:alkylation response protein AidB-like acyl-CoA dehydrogenase
LVIVGGPYLADRLWPSVDGLISAEALDAIAAGAAAGDESGQVPDASLQAVRSSGYLGLPVPKDFEGAGASALECCAVQRRLAAADPALAVALEMHLFSVGVMTAHWRRERDTSWLLLEAIATQNRLVAAAFAEPGLSGSFLRSHCRARRVDGGWRVSGVKAPCSLAERSDLVCFQAEAEEAGPDSLLVALVPSHEAGMRVERTWDSLGMRASESDTLVLEDCFVPDELVFHRCAPGYDPDEVFATGVNWFCVTTTATYLGLANAAIGAVTAELERSSVSYLGAARAELPGFQSSLGEAVASLMTAEAACVAVAALVDDPLVDPHGLMPLCIALKHSTAELLTGVVGEIFDLPGAAAYGRASELGRLFRDVQAARFHPPTGHATRQILGRWALGLPYTVELFEHPVGRDELEALRRSLED